METALLRGTNDILINVDEAGLLFLFCPHLPSNSGTLGPSISDFCFGAKF